MADFDNYTERPPGINVESSDGNIVEEYRYISIFLDRKYPYENKNIDKWREKKCAENF